MTDTEPAGRTANRFQRAVNRLSIWFTRFRRRFIPYLVWHGDEVDVRITFKEDPLPEGLSPDDAARTFKSGGLHEIQQRMRHMGINFDTGQGFGGRDWEWDFSLRGPVNVKFRGRAKRPERRVRPEPKKPNLSLVA